MTTDRSSLPKLAWVRDLEAFEGPILSEYEDADGALFLQKWCAYVDGAVRFLVVRSHRLVVADYLNGDMSMLDLLTKPNDDAGWLVDRVGDEVRNVIQARVSELPPKYLPKPSAMHDEDLRPAGFER